MTPVALVTGGAHGLGRAACVALAAAGHRVLVVDVDEEAGEEVADAVGGAFFRADVASLDDNRAMVEEARSRFGRLDAVNLNAGVATGCDLGPAFDLERYRRAFGVNLDGVVFGTHAALAAFGAGGGAITITASLAGLTPLRGEPLYTANKHAVVGLTRALGPSLARQGVRLNAVCPGFTDSRFIDPRRGQLLAAGIPIIPPGNVADVVVELLVGDRAGECWVVQPGVAPGPFRFDAPPGPVPA